MSRTPIGQKPASHCVQVMSSSVVCLTSASAAAFGASAVTNIELVTAVAANAVHMMYEPIRRAEGPGSEPYRPGMLRMTGKMVPALRPVFDGVPGARARSAERDGIAQAERPCRRAARTSQSATRRPSPVLS